VSTWCKFCGEDAYDAESLGNCCKKRERLLTKLKAQVPQKIGELSIKIAEMKDELECLIDGYQDVNNLYTEAERQLDVKFDCPSVQLAAA